MESSLFVANRCKWYAYTRIYIVYVVGCQTGQSCTSVHEDSAAESAAKVVALVSEEGGIYQ